MTAQAPVAQPQSPPAREGAPPAAATPDRDAFTFTSYDLNVRIDPAQHLLSVRGTLEARNDSGKRQTLLPLQISSQLKWAQLRVDERASEFSSKKVQSDIDHTGSVNEALVPLPNGVPAGAVIKVEFGYQGTVTADVTRLSRIGTPAKLAALSDWDQISLEFTAVRGLGHVAWYPVAVEPALLGDGNKVFDEMDRWRARHSRTSFHARYEQNPGRTLIRGDRLPQSPFFVLGNYSTQHTQNGDVFFRAGSEESAKRYAAVLAQGEDLIGHLPEEKATLVQLPDGYAGFDGGTVLLAPLKGLPESEIKRTLIHTMTHADFDSPRPWIYEGLATLAQVELVEQQGGRPAAIEFLAQGLPSLTLYEASAGQKASLATSGAEVMWRTKAAYFWWMVRDIVGDNFFREALARYRVEDDKTPDYIQRLLEKTSGRDLEYLFDDWVYRDPGLPEFKVTQVYPRQNLKGGYLVTVTVENSGGAGAEVPIILRTKAGEITTRLELRAHDKASARVETPLVPIDVTVNDGSVPETDSSDNTYILEGPKKE